MDDNEKGDFWSRFALIAGGVMAEGLIRKLIGVPPKVPSWLAGRHEVRRWPFPSSSSRVPRPKPQTLPPAPPAEENSTKPESESAKSIKPAPIPPKPLVTSPALARTNVPGLAAEERTVSEPAPLPPAERIPPVTSMAARHVADHSSLQPESASSASSCAQEAPADASPGAGTDAAASGPTQTPECVRGATTPSSTTSVPAVAGETETPDVGPSSPTSSPSCAPPRRASPTAPMASKVHLGGTRCAESMRSKAYNTGDYERSNSLTDSDLIAVGMVSYYGRPYVAVDVLRAESGSPGWSLLRRVRSSSSSGWGWRIA